MKTLNNIKIRFISEEKEILEQVVDKLLNWADIEDETKADLVIEEATGLKDQTIYVMHLMLTNSKQIKSMLAQIRENTNTESKLKIIETVESRIDEDLNLYLRYETNEFLQDKLNITDEGKCIHFTLNIAAFPKKLEKGIEIAKTIFTDSN